jgi:hypothetical protein
VAQQSVIYSTPPYWGGSWQRTCRVLRCSVNTCHTANSPAVNPYDGKNVLWSRSRVCRIALNRTRLSRTRKASMTRERTMYFFQVGHVTNVHSFAAIASVSTYVRKCLAGNGTKRAANREGLNKVRCAGWHSRPRHPEW